MTETSDLRVKKTYTALNKSFEELLKSKDFYDISVSEICKNAMVGRGTFYKYFTSKYDYLSFYICKIVNDCLNNIRDEGPIDNLCLYYKTFFNKFIDTIGAYNYNFKLDDNYTAMGIAFSPVNDVYKKLHKQLQSFYPENYKLNCFMAKYLSIALILIVFDFIQINSHNPDEAKEAMSLLLDKLFAYE